MEESVAINDSLLFDADGFFLEPGKWTVAIAKHIAHLDGLGALSAEQLELVHKLRGEFEKNGTLPGA